MSILVSKVEAKSQTHRIVKSQNLNDNLRFTPNFLSHLKSNYIPVCAHKFSRSMNNMAPLNSIRVLRAPPPHESIRSWGAMADRVKGTLSPNENFSEGYRR